MSAVKTTENQTKKLFLQRLFDVCIVAVLSLGILGLYESYITSIYASKENMYAISFDIFSVYFDIVLLFLVLIVPNFLEFFNSRKIICRYTEEKHIPSTLVRWLKVIISTLFIVVCLVTFAYKNSRIEFYDDGRIVEYNSSNQVEYKYNKSDVEFVELKTNHISGRNYWTEAIIYTKDNRFVLRTENYIVPDEFEYVYQTECTLYGLKKVKKTFLDRIIIDSENLDIFLHVESPCYTREQAKELCEIFETDFDEMMLWLKEEWDIVL